MKKNIVFLFFVFSVCVFIQNQASCASVMEPQWGEFCPPMYENAVFKTDSDNSSKYRENNYWALRKVKFDKSVLECKVISKTQSELNTCFARVANIEKNKTNQKREAKYERNADYDREIKESATWWY